MGQKRAIKQLEVLDKNSNFMRLAAEGWENQFQTLISIIMSARTRDETTIEVAKKLFFQYPTPEKLSKTNLFEIQNIIRPVNFYINKSKNILNCSKEIVDKFGGDVPNEIEKLITLPGVGRKTANVFISECGSHGIGVDTHVSYISQYLGWTKNKNAQKIETDLKLLFPKNYWSKVNPILVRFGKTHTSKTKKNKLLDKIKKIK